MSAFGGKADMRPRSRSSPPDKRDVFLQRVAAQLELRRNTCDVIVDAAAQTALQGLVQLLGERRANGTSPAYEYKAARYHLTLD